MKLTGGARFDPSEESIYFFAGLNNSLLRERGGQHSYLLVALNDVAENEPELKSIDETLDSHPDLRVLLDSGIFWLTNQHMRSHPGMTMDEALSLAPTEIDNFDWLWRNYLSTVSRFEERLWGYIELDQGGADNKRRTRAKLEAEGLVPIPVYHPLNDGWDYFDELAQEYDRICVGNIVQANREVRRHLLSTIWERKRAYPHLWIHVLGLTPSEVFTVYPQASCDSSTFVYAIRFGATTARGHAMGNAFGELDSSFSYDKTLGDGPGGYATGIQSVTGSARFLHENTRAQQRDYREVFGQDLWPSTDAREGVRV